jgi:hypothetical protein
MYMRFVSAAMVASLTLSATLARGVEAPNYSADRLKQLNERIATANAGKTAEYAKDLLETAQISLVAAQAAVAGGNEKTAQQKLETAELQLTLADAKATEKELAEQVAVRRVELKKLETQLEKYRQGEGI